jgi:F0F1-type ATP synthase assembly protein I
MVLDYLIVGLLWLHHIQPLANATMATIAFGKIGKLVLPRTSC